MKDGLRFVDCDMHIMEPVNLFDKYLNKKFRDRIVLPVDSKGPSKRGMIVIDGKATSLDHEMTRCSSTGSAHCRKSQDGDLEAAVGLPHGGGRVSQFCHRPELRRGSSSRGHGA